MVSYAGTRPPDTDPMNRRGTLLALLALSTAPIAANAQQPRRVWRIGVLRPGNPRVRKADDGYVKAMSELGYAVGRDYVFEERFAERDLSRLPVLAAELVASRVDIIMPQGTPAAIAARNATQVIPIVLMGVGDPLGTGLVTNLARPEGNITGFVRHAGVPAKHLDLLRQLVPGMARVGAMYDPKNIIEMQYRTELESSCKQLGMRMISAPIGSPNDVAKAFSHLKQERAQGLVVLQAVVFDGGYDNIIQLAAKHRLPAIFDSITWVEKGGLISYSPVFDDLYRHVATYVDRIFKGAKPGDLPIEQPNTFNLVINRKTAKALGLAIPQSLLIMADRIID